MITLRGTPVSPGYAEGEAVIYGALPASQIPRYPIAAEQVAREQQRFHQAREHSSAELREIRDRVLAEFGQPESEIFSAQLAMLNDRHIGRRVEQRIADEHVNVEQAVAAEASEITEKLGGAETQYLRDRAADVRDVTQRLLRHLIPGAARSLVELPPNAVVVARELLPSDTVNLDREHLAGIVTERGGLTSHTAILARSLGVPAITGVAHATSRIAPGARVLVDAERGRVAVAPTTKESTRFSGARARYVESSVEVAASELRECITEDGVRIALMANVGRPEEAEEVLRHRLDGVGLFRTEFMVMDALEEPGTAVQMRAYRRVVETLGQLPVVIRTWDLGGDKVPPFMAENLRSRPALGVRGLRLSLTVAREMLVSQVRAVLEAGRGHNVSILLPMVLGRGDLREAIALVRGVAAEMKVERVPPIGAMIETPAAVFCVDQILELADFVSIGSNDLTQFVLASNREAVELIDEYSVLHPSVLRAIHQVVRAAERAGKPLSVCGEAAGDAPTACLLVGMGVRVLSMSPVRAARVRYTLQRLKVERARAIVERVLGSETTREVKAKLRGLPGESRRDAEG